MALQVPLPMGHRTHLRGEEGPIVRLGDLAIVQGATPITKEEGIMVEGAIITTLLSTSNTLLIR